MKIIVEKESLVSSLSNINNSVSKKNVTIPILSNVKIETKDGKVNLVGTDLETAIIASIKARIDTDGVTTVPSQLLFDISKKVPDGSEITLELNSDKTIMSIKYGNSKFKLPCLDPETFPSIEDTGVDKSFTIKTADFAKIIDKSKFAISTDETRYYLNGIFFHTRKVDDVLMIRSVATDGHRLALSEVKAPDGFEELTGVIIPRKVVGEIRKILENANEDIKISLSKTKIIIDSGNTTLISKLIDGEFPDYERVIPSGNDKLITIDKKQFFDAIDRVATIVTEKHKGIKLKIANNLINLSVEAMDGSFASDEVAVNYSAEEIETAFNSRYLLDILLQITSANVIIKLKDGNSPTILQGEEEKDSLFVLMPIRI